MGCLRGAAKSSFADRRVYIMGIKFRWKNGYRALQITAGFYPNLSVLIGIESLVGIFSRYVVIHCGFIRILICYSNFDLLTDEE